MKLINDKINREKILIQVKNSSKLPGIQPLSEVDESD